MPTQLSRADLNILTMSPLHLLFHSFIAPGLASDMVALRRPCALRSALSAVVLLLTVHATLALDLDPQVLFACCRTASDLSALQMWPCSSS